jgi:hypothetical protein
MDDGPQPGGGFAAYIEYAGERPGGLVDKLEDTGQELLIL